MPNHPIKRSVKLEPGEAFIVATRQEWDHVILVYRQAMKNAPSSKYYNEWSALLERMVQWVIQSENEIEDEPS